MPQIMGLTRHKYSKMPTKLLDDDLFRYCTHVGKLCTQRTDSYAYADAEKFGGNVYTMYKNYSIIYENGQPIGYYNGDLVYPRTLNYDPMHIADIVVDLTKSEITKHRHSIFYTDAAYELAMRYL